MPNPTEPKRPRASKKTNSKQVEEKRGVGRPKGSFKPPEDKCVKCNITLLPSEKDLLKLKGGSAWVRKMLALDL